MRQRKLPSGRNFTLLPSASAFRASHGIRHRRPGLRWLDFTNRRYRHRGVVNEAEKARNRTKSKVRAKVEHCFGVIKRVFGFTKVRYRGLDKNAHRLFVTCALTNLFVVRHRLLRL